MMSYTELRDRAKQQSYPANQNFDPITLKPQGVACERIRLMENNLPELMAGGESLLDIGSNKGLVSLLLRDRYNHIDGYERAEESHDLAELTRQYHGFENVRFVNKSFRRIPFGTGRKIGENHEEVIPSEPYEVVYAGSVHHHFIKDALLHNAPMFLPLQKLKALAKKYLILDGPFTFENDCSLTTWETQYGWPPSVREAYTFDAHVEALAPWFRLVRGPVPNERGRQSAVFERVASDVPHETWTDGKLDMLREIGEVIPANKARPEGSVIRARAVRYKFDIGLQTDGVFGVLNSLPEWCAKTCYVLIQNGNRIGDVAKWVEGEPAEAKDIGEWWLRLNDILACVGLIEIHFKRGDYILRDGHMIDVDFDMVADVDKIAWSHNYLAKWVRAGPSEAFAGDLPQWIAANLNDEFVFQKALQKMRTQ